MARHDIQGLVMKLVSGAKYIPEDDLIMQVEHKLPRNNTAERKVKPEYIIKRTIKRLQESGKLERAINGGVCVISLTQSGAETLHRSSVSAKQNILPTLWDGLWRIVILDFESDDKKARDAVRYMLKKANFLCLKQSVWISPHNLEGFIREMKYHMKLTSEVMFIVGNSIDTEIEHEVCEYFSVAKEK